MPTLTYLANAIRVGRSRDSVLGDHGHRSRRDGWRQGLDPGPESDAIVLNDWAARDLRVRVGDPVSIEYYVWETEGRLSTRTADFRVAGIVPIAGAAADRDLVPEYPGITDSDRLADWDPPFPIDLERVRPSRRGVLETLSRDAEGLHPDRAGPGAVALASWGADGAASSCRRRESTLAGSARSDTATALRAELDPLALGFSVYDVRAQSLAASAGATDFGEYFTYFSTLPRRVRAAAGGALLQARRRAAAAGNRVAAGRRASIPPRIRRLFRRRGASCCR